MSDAKWTPGPWRLSKPHEMHGVNVIAGKDDFVCEVGFPAPHNPVEADAHLIAAAPELYEALKVFADCCEYIDSDEDDEEWAKFRLLIKNYRSAKTACDKARGQS